MSAALKLRPRFIEPFTVIAKKDLAHTLNLPCCAPTPCFTPVCCSRIGTLLSLIERRLRRVRWPCRGNQHSRHEVQPDVFSRGNPCFRLGRRVSTTSNEPDRYTCSQSATIPVKYCAERSDSKSNLSEILHLAG